jgi:branched-chain amino acid transport system ATP-binding protein
MAAMLTVEGLSVNYGRLAALREVSIRVDPGELVCIVGPNGAGKSSLMNAIAGGVVPRGGSAKFENKELVGMRPEHIARLGMSLVPEGRQVFSTLTVEENLRLGTLIRRRSADDELRLARIMRHFPRLDERRKAPAGTLSGGEQQMLVIGRALMTQPRLVMVDEPSLGLAPMIVDQVYEILRDLRQAEGLTLLINEQSSKRVLKYADRIYVLRGGVIRLEGSAENLQDGAAILQAYFGFARPTANAGLPA